jgi:hypothetical protein
MFYDRSPEARRSKIFGRIAIWNTKKFIFAITMAIWITDSSLFLLGKYLQILQEKLMYTGDIIIIATIRVNFQFRLFWTCLAYLTTAAPC